MKALTKYKYKFETSEETSKNGWTRCYKIKNSRSVLTNWGLIKLN